jgi:hypothetical protein
VHRLLNVPDACPPIHKGLATKQWTGHHTEGSGMSKCFFVADTRGLHCFSHDKDAVTDNRGEVELRECVGQSVSWPSPSPKAFGWAGRAGWRCTRRSVWTETMLTRCVLSDSATATLDFATLSVKPLLAGKKLLRLGTPEGAELAMVSGHHGRSTDKTTTVAQPTHTLARARALAPLTKNKTFPQKNAPRDPLCLFAQGFGTGAELEAWVLAVCDIIEDSTGVRPEAGAQLLDVVSAVTAHSQRSKGVGQGN